jgi:hypothetical protein
MGQDRLKGTVKRTAATLSALFLGFASILNAQPKTVALQSLQEDLRLDARKEDFSVVGPVQLSASGSLAITLRQDFNVRIYDRNGRQTAAFGKRGSGPGEFIEHQVTGWVGDTVLIYDAAQRRFTYLSKEGKLVRTEALSRLRAPVPRNDSQGTWKLDAGFVPHAKAADGTLLGISMATRTLSGQTERSLAVVSRVPGADPHLVSTIPTPDGRWQAPFGPALVVAFSNDAKHIGFVDVDRMALSGGSFRVSKLQTSGTTVFSTQLAYAGVPLRASFVDSVLAKGVGPDGVRSVKRDRIPPVLSPVVTLRFSDNGLTWVVQRLSESRNVVILLDAMGNEISRFASPERSELVVASSTHLWFKEVDADGMTSLVRYRYKCPVPECQGTVSPNSGARKR